MTDLSDPWWSRAAFDKRRARHRARTDRLLAGNPSRFWAEFAGVMLALVVIPLLAAWLL